MLDRFLGGYVTASPTPPSQTSAQGVWELEQQASAQVQNAWPLPPNVIQRSLRFNSADSAYLNRSVSTSNRQIFTFSAWAKKGKTPPSGTEYFFSARQAASDNFGISFQTSSVLQVDGAVGGSGFQITTSAVYRDPSAWYHILLAIDTTQGTASNRARLYVNGTEVTSFSTATYMAQNASLAINLSTAVHNISGYNNSSNYFDGYLAEINFVDGQQLTPSSFGETDAQTGVWVPKVYTGSYGTNGFRLRFNNNTSTTALGYDSSGNGNNWTPNNFSVTAGSGNDSMLDVPSLYGTDTGLGGEVRGNYCTTNPLAGSTTGTITYSNGNLDFVLDRSANNCWVTSTFAIPSSGKWYFETSQTATNTGTTAYGFVGVMDITTSRATATPTEVRAYIFNSGNKTSTFATSGSSYGSALALSDIAGVAIDMDAGTITFYKNGVSQGIAFSDLVSSGKTWAFTGFLGGNNTGTFWANFGQRPFAYTAPSGFKALCTTNLSASGTVTTSGTFTGNASTDGPFVYLNGIPTAMTINGNAVTFGTQADKLSNGFKVRSSSASYNTSGSNTYSVSTTGAIFRYSNAQGNP